MWRWLSRCGKKCRTLNQPVYPGKRGKSRRKSLRPDEGRVQGLFEADYLSMQKKVWLNAWKQQRDCEIAWRTYSL